MASSQTQIREGFLCPICLKDLGEISKLELHFLDEHSAPEQEKSSQLSNLKGIFDKAKKKLVPQSATSQTQSVAPNQLDSHDISLGNEPGAFDQNVIYNEPQEMGLSRNHTPYFKNIREARIDRFVIETNKLLIRLDKLMMPPDSPNVDSSKRKAHEKSVVHWVADSDMRLCMTCGQSFSFLSLRRRHHCRLCGGIICSKCSHFLPFSYGRRLTDPSYVWGESEGATGFKRSNSSDSLNSMFSPEGEPHLRTCRDCRELIEIRDEQIQRKATKQPVVLLYQRLSDAIHEAEDLLVGYNQMATSLHAGESSYTLFEAQAIQQKLAKLYDAIDSFSKRIVALSQPPPGPDPTGKVGEGQQQQQQQQQPIPMTPSSVVHRSIRHFAIQFLQEKLRGLLPLPNQEELEERQQQRQEVIHRQIEEERRQMMERERRLKLQQERYNQISASRKTNVPSSTDSNDSGGWLAAQTQTSHNQDGASSHSLTEGDTPNVSVRAKDLLTDPMIQQMNNVRSFIAQAKQGHKWDEVQMLTKNLAELEKEYILLTGHPPPR